MTTALQGYLHRLDGVVTSRLAGPKARKGTRWWGEQGKSLYLPAGYAGLETKTLDVGYVLPDKLVGEVDAAVRPVALRVAYDAAAHTATALGVTVPDTGGDGMFAVDHDLLNSAVEDAVAQIMDVARHHAADVRAAITAADSSADTLDEVLDRVEEAHRRGGNWVLMAGRTLANGLTQDAALGQARALGVTHAQWISRRDPRVRPTHVAADGQVRPIGEHFQVGAFRLLHPGDPGDLPASWSEVAGCRCGLSFDTGGADRVAALRTIAQTTPGQRGPGVNRLLGLASTPVNAQPAALGTAAGLGADALADARQVVTDAPVVGYRAMNEAITATAGQWMVAAGPVVLGMVAPAVIAEGAPALTVLIPAGTTLLLAGGAIVLPAGQPLEVLASGAAGTQAQVAALPSTPSSGAG